MPEPWVWVVRGELGVQAATNAVVFYVSRGEDEEQARERLRRSLPSDAAVGAAEASARHREGRAQLKAREAREAVERQERVSRGYDPLTGRPPSPPGQERERERGRP